MMSWIKAATWIMVNYMLGKKVVMPFTNIAQQASVTEQIEKARKGR